MNKSLHRLASFSFAATLLAGCASYTTVQRPVAANRHATTRVVVDHEKPADIAAWEPLGDVRIVGSGMPSITACEDHIDIEGRALGAELAVVHPGSSGQECGATYYVRKTAATTSGTAPTAQ
jgi:hypothetical protein